MAPQAFLDCVAAGGKVRSRKVKGGRYIKFCFPPDGGPGVASEVEEGEKPKKGSLKQTATPEARKYERE